MIPRDKTYRAQFVVNQTVIVDSLTKVIDAAAEMQEFGEIEREAERLRTKAIGIQPRDFAFFLARMMAIIGFVYRWRGVMTLAAITISALGAGFFLWYAVTKIHQLMVLWQESSIQLVTPAYAAAAERTIDPIALVIFQIVIALMVPTLTVGAFCALIFAQSAEGRKAGRDILIAVMGFVLGAATRFL
jgi:maltodextrin utilization protein YvdJ